MVSSNDSFHSDESIQQYQAEMQRMRAELQTVVTTLDAPLRQLVQARVDALRPEVRAAIVLAAGVPEQIDGSTDTDASGEHDLLRIRRIHLAAALEMLTAALSIHKLLLTNEALDLDKSVLGGTILAGDYCFGSAAAMAVKTDSPEVVKLFSDALKSVSEGNLRHLFSLTDEGQSDDERAAFDPQADETAIDPNPKPFDDNLELFHAGVISAMTLSGQPVGNANPVLEFVTKLAHSLNAQGSGFSSNHAKIHAELLALTVNLPAHQRLRWRHLLTWLLENK